MAVPVVGTLEISVNGRVLSAKGEFTITDGEPELEPVIGADGRVAAMVENHKAPMIEGAITLASGDDPAEIKRMRNGTVIARIGSGKGFVLSQASFAGPGEVKSREHEMSVRWVGVTGEWLN